MVMNRMIPSDDDKTTAKTSLIMTRSMSEDIGLKVKKTLESIDKKTINYSYAQWQEYVSYIWSDDIWIMALNKAIRLSKESEVDLNRNKYFLDLIWEMSPTELKNEFKKTHPIARLALMDLIDKKPPKPERRRKYEDLWLTPKELREKYKNYEEDDD